MVSPSVADRRLHRHVLHLETKNEAYICDLCREHGSGERYHCIQFGCSDPRRYHKFCARPERDLNHPFFRGCCFNLVSIPVGSDFRYYCSACAKPIEGCSYRCGHSRHDRYLHPSCATLRPTVRVSGQPGDAGPMELYLVDKLTSDCLRCGVKKVAIPSRKRSFLRPSDVETVHTWGYATSDGEHSVHVGCMKRLMAECWERRVFRSDARTQTFGTDMALATTTIDRSQLWLPTTPVHRRSWWKKLMRMVRIVASLTMSMFGLMDPMAFVWSLADVFHP